MRTYANGFTVKVASGPLRSAFLSLADPVLAIGLYVILLRVFGERFGYEQAAITVVSFLLLYPGKFPFTRFSASVAGGIVLSWLLIAAMVLALRLVHADFVVEDAALLRVDATTAWLAVAPSVLVGLHALSPLFAPQLRRLYRRTKVIIVGMNAPAARMAETLEMGEAQGQHLVACFDDRQTTRAALAGRWPLAGGFADVGRFVREHGIERIYISLPMSSNARVKALLDELGDSTASVCFLPDIFVADVIQGSVQAVGGLPVVAVCDTPFQGSSGLVKRTLDVVVTVAALPLVVPLMAGIALMIKWSSPGPAFFRQRRYGLDGKEIVIWKFRTMRIDEDCANSYTAVTRDDDRVTPLGRFLRRTSLDELPQLINVMEGSMSLVGPRPHALAVNEQYRRLIPGYMVRHKVKPGITGWAQVNGLRGGNDLDSMRKRTEYDLAYLRSWSLGLDLLIIARTARILILGDPRAF